MKAAFSLVIIALLTAFGCGGEADRTYAHYVIDNTRSTPFAVVDSLFELTLIPLSRQVAGQVGDYPIYIREHAGNYIIVDRLAGVSCVSGLGELVWHLDDRYLEPSENSPIRYAHLNAFSGKLEISGGKDFSLRVIDLAGHYVETRPLPQQHDNAAVIGPDTRLLETSGYAIDPAESKSGYYRLGLAVGDDLRYGLEVTPVPPATHRHYYFDHTLFRWRDSLFYTRPLLNTLYRVDTSERRLLPCLSWEFARGEAASDPFEDRKVEDAFTFISDRNLALPRWVAGDEALLFINYDLDYQNYLTAVRSGTTLFNTGYLEIDGTLVPVPSLHVNGLMAAVYPRDLHELLQSVRERPVEARRGMLQGYFSQEPAPRSAAMLAIMRVKS